MLSFINLFILIPPPCHSHIPAFSSSSPGSSWSFNNFLTALPPHPHQPLLNYIKVRQIPWAVGSLLPSNNKVFVGPRGRELNAGYSRRGKRVIVREDVGKAGVEKARNVRKWKRGEEEEVIHLWKWFRIALLDFKSVIRPVGEHILIKLAVAITSSRLRGYYFLPRSL